MTANRIKHAALTLFAESGYEGVSLSEIAKSVGIKTPSIYAHFESKEQLLLELIDDAIREEHAKFMQMLAETTDHPPMDRLNAAFIFYTDLDHISQGQSFLKRTLLVPPRHLEERLGQDFIAYENQVSEHLMELLNRSVLSVGGFHPESEQTERLLALFYALIDGLLVEYKLYDSALYRRRQALIWDCLRESVERTTPKPQPRA
ncbi:TetR/AcrR family transcriptional regulator [Paenibacillus sp. OV219]|uniref:TetR/AcrR family transcriptional regulator n=1 Tax=Paenibacillus sp. OV219 TaxID=1884377 RepID=UPI0008D7D24C|nr:TetR/AcrR family transcriptional regulator [Paenibacillus sp. OV219]SEN58703.1 transcriptional regulator, TetR family [Paenibacillus sp. OV219]